MQSLAMAKTSPAEAMERSLPSANLTTSVSGAPPEGLLHENSAGIDEVHKLVIKLGDVLRSAAESDAVLSSDATSGTSAPVSTTAIATTIISSAAGNQLDRELRNITHALVTLKSSLANQTGNNMNDATREVPTPAAVAETPIDASQAEENELHDVATMERQTEEIVDSIKKGVYTINYVTGRLQDKKGRVVELPPELAEELFGTGSPSGAASKEAAVFHEEASHETTQSVQSALDSFRSSAAAAPAVVAALPPASPAPPVNGSLPLSSNGQRSSPHASGALAISALLPPVQPPSTAITAIADASVTAGSFPTVHNPPAASAAPVLSSVLAVGDGLSSATTQPLQQPPQPPSLASPSPVEENAGALDATGGFWKGNDDDPLARIPKALEEALVPVQSTLEETGASLSATWQIKLPTWLGGTNGGTRTSPPTLAPTVTRKARGQVSCQQQFLCLPCITILPLLL